MYIRRDLQPFVKYRATEASLDLSKDVAHAMGLPFDREAVRAQSGTLYDDMFADLLQILDVDKGAIQFHSGIYYQTRAFTILKDESTPTIALDMTFDHWVLSMVHLLSISTFSAPAKDEYVHIVEDISSLFGLFTNASAFEATLIRMVHYLRTYPNLLNLSGALARAIVIFVLCHEIAHCTLGHLEIEASHKTELEADTHALELFINVVEYGYQDSDTCVYVDPKVVCAPIVLPMILKFYEAWLAKYNPGVTFSNHHPTAQDRLLNAEKILESNFNDASKQIVKGLDLSIMEMRDFMNL